MKKRIIIKKLVSMALSMALLGSLLPQTSVVSASESDVYTSDLPVQKVSGLSEDFFMGADVSSAQALIDAGVKYYDYEGNEGDLYEIMADAGINYVRLRLWNDPFVSTATTADSKTVANSYGAGVCDINYVTKMALAAKKAGLKVFLDFHYSDFWADPGKQKLPKAWSTYSGNTLNQAVYDFTYDSLVTLKNAGVDNIAICQIGNETTSGVSGTSYGTTAYYNVFKYGCNAVRDYNVQYNTDIKNCIHFTNQASFNYKSVCQNFINAGVDFDILGSSFYPEWGSHGTIESLCTNLKNAKSVKNTITGKNIDVMVAEVGYRYMGSTSDENGVYAKYGISKEGQAVFMRDLIKGVSDIGGLGVFYWEPAWVACGCNYNTDGTGWATDNAAEYEPNFTKGGECATTNLALFAKKGTKQIQATEVLNVFKYVYKGTSSAPEEVVLGDNLVSNNSFENDYNNGNYGNLREVSDWTLVSSVGDTTDMPIYIENNSGYDGDSKLSIWTDSYSNYTVEAYQEIDISGTGAGKYYVSMYACGNVGNIYAYIKDGKYSETVNNENINISLSSNYQKYEGEVTVTNTSTITVGVKAVGVSTNAWANIDYVEVRYAGSSDGNTNPDNPDNPDNPEVENKILTAPVVKLVSSDKENTYGLSWNSVENATSYDVMVGGNVIATTKDTSYYITAPYTGLNRVNVVAKADGYTEAKSTSLTVNVPDEVLSLDLDDNGSLIWNFTAGGEADGFTISQLLNDGNYKEIGRVNASGASKYSYSLTNGKTYATGYKNTFKVTPFTSGTIIILGKSKTISIQEDPEDVDAILPSVGEKIQDKKYIYKVTKAGSSKTVGEVSVTGLKKKSLKTIKIAAKVTIGGITYKVTAVDKNAFKNNKKIKKAYIGSNVKTIGANAFFGCKKLKNVVIKSTVLKKIGKKAFKGIKKKAKFKVPKAKKAKYKKMIKKAGAKNPKVK